MLHMLVVEPCITVRKCGGEGRMCVLPTLSNAQRRVPQHAIVHQLVMLKGQLQVWTW